VAASGPADSQTTSREEIDAIVAFLKSLDGEGWQDVAPSHFPR
jgi:hypothetical protein